MLGTAVRQRTRGLAEAVRAYVGLTKPRIVLLLLVTTVPAMVLAQEGWPSPWRLLVTLVGGALAAGGANALNCYFDRDIDSVMLRTRRRPIPAGTVEPERALAFGLALGALGALLMQAFVGTLAALLTIGAYGFYVLVYTLALKRSTPLNIVIGGAAGAMPPVIGWAAVREEVGVAALLLFGVVFFWTPVHFWALSLNYRQDYQRAGVPMLPVVKGEAETRRLILLHALATVALSLALPWASAAGAFYLAVAGALGAALLAQCLWLLWRPSLRRAATLFQWSNLYLAVLFAALAVDVLAF
ncbi:MAG TPA: heme o synthase [Dehalococcoidia bacterium]|nr:heme o synthase [Dehalococcoidia bacterium]